MKKIYLLIALVLLPLCLSAQKQEEDASAAYERPEQSEKKSQKVFTGFSGGMMLHIGYMFSDSPEKLFSSTGLGNEDFIKNLPKSGVCLGLGGTLRIHLINHIHLGAEGGVSTMPLMGTGSSVRAGWGGAICDFYTNWGIVRPIIGLGIGGGKMKRLYVPKEAEDVYVTDNDSTYYNASYTKAPFFYIDPYVGLEIGLGSHMALMIRVDYMLPFGRSQSGLTNLTSDIKWSNFMTPTGPRLYVGLMFGKMKKDKEK